jgi:hypothetical protein
MLWGGGFKGGELLAQSVIELADDFEIGPLRMRGPEE